MLDHISLIGEGFVNTCLIVLLSCILPLMVGTLLIFFASRGPVVAKIFHWLSLPMEALTPSVLLIMLSFSSELVKTSGAGFLAVVITLTLSFIGYMPARYRADFSFLKNLLYNGCGLISALIKWSTIASLIAYLDLLRVFQNIVARTYESSPYIFAFLAFFAMVFIFELAKRIINQFMK